jgi:hypothetical protein
MGKSHLKKGIENWPTWKVLLVTWGVMIIFIVLLFLAASIHNTLFGYVVFGMYILLGLAMVVKFEDIGSALFEGNIRWFKFVWRNLFYLNDAEIQNRELRVESGPLGLKFHIGITFFVGLGLIAMSIWAITMLSKGSLYG